MNQSMTPLPLSMIAELTGDGKPVPAVVAAQQLLI